MNNNLLASRVVTAVGLQFPINHGGVQAVQNGANDIEVGVETFVGFFIDGDIAGYMPNDQNASMEGIMEIARNNGASIIGNTPDIDDREFGEDNTTLQLRIQGGNVAPVVDAFLAAAVFNRTGESTFECSLTGLNKRMAVVGELWDVEDDLFLLLEQGITFYARGNLFGNPRREHNIHLGPLVHALREQGLTVGAIIRPEDRPQNLNMWPRVAIHQMNVVLQVSGDMDVNSLRDLLDQMLGGDDAVRDLWIGANNDVI